MSCALLVPSAAGPRPKSCLGVSELPWWEANPPDSGELKMVESHQIKTVEFDRIGAS